MKHLFPVVLAAMTSLPAAAEQLSPDESLARLAAMQNGPSRARAFASQQLKLVYTEKEAGANTVYVFNRPDGEGFIILSADDLAPEVLGYSEDGIFEESKVAPHFLEWLKDYSNTINRAIIANKPVGSSAHRAKRENIAPILKSKWGQGSNYDGMNIFNQYCPKVNGTLCPTGCEATAVAQIMYHYKYPLKGIGSSSYTSQTHNLSLNANFGNTNYDWDAMQDAYGVYIAEDGEYKTAEVSTRANEAVSRLMYHCGVAMNMDYAPGGSGAYTFEAMRGLIENFGYNPMMSYRLREYYSDDAWESMIYEQIAQGIPLLYCGSTVKNEGHAFVCDGYKDGLYHINWGWDGMSDGYYTILGDNSLHPKRQGTGGSYTADAFNQNHEILCGFLPPSEVTSPTHTFCMDGVYEVYDSATKKPKLHNGGKARISIEEGAFSFTYKTCNYAFGLKLESEDADKTYYLPFDSEVPYYELGFTYGIGGYFVDCNGVEDGVYTTTPVYRVEGEDSWTPIVCASTTPVKIAYGNAELPDPDPDPDPDDGEKVSIFCSSISLTSDYDFMRTAHIEVMHPGNVGNSAFDGYVAPVLYDKDGKYVGVLEELQQEFKINSMKYEETKTFKFDVLLPENCDNEMFYIALAAHRKNSEDWSLAYLFDLDNLSVSQDNPATIVWVNGDIVTDKETPTGGWLDNAALVCSDVTSPVSLDSNRQLHVHINNPGNIGSDYFNGWITPCIFDENGNGIALFPELAQSFEMESMKFSRDISFDFVVDLPEELSDGTYLASVLGLQKYSHSWTTFSTIENEDDGANIVRNTPYFEFKIRGNNVTTGDVVNILAPATETSADHLNIYDIYGRQVNRSGNSLNTLNKIVISNGRKILKR